MYRTQQIWALALTMTTLGLAAGCNSSPQIAGAGPVSGGGNGAVDQIDWPAVQVDPIGEDTAGFNRVTSADLNGDGLLDLISAASESQPIQVHLQQRGPSGTITFDSFSVAGSGPIVLVSSLKVADMDRDGNLDIVLSSQDNGFAPADLCAVQQCSLVILFSPDDPSDALNWTRYNLTYNHRCLLVNDTALTFDTLGFDGNSMCYSSMDVGDANRDGFPDILAAFNGCDDERVANKRVELWINPGTARIRDNAVLLGDTKIDTDFDGVADACVADVDNPWQRVILQQDILDIGNVRLSDVDLDSDLDAVAVRPNSKTFDITWQPNPLFPQGSVNIEFWGVDRLHPIGESDSGVINIEIGDLDGDGLEDVLATTQADRVLRWFKRAKDPAAQEFPWDVFNMVQFSELVPTAMDIVDLDLDGQLDVVAAAGGRVRWFTPAAQSPFQAWSEQFVANDTESHITSVHGVDINGDGRLDVAATLDRPGVDEDAIIWMLNSNNTR